MKEKDGQNIKILISIVAREGGGHEYPFPSSRATFLLASTFRENARVSLLSRAASLKKRACSQVSFSMTIKILHFEHTLFICGKNKLCSLPAKCSKIQIFEIIELNSVVSGAVTCK